MAISPTDKDSSISLANAAEREANRRINAAGERVKEVQKETDHAIRHIQDAYEKQSLAQSARQEAALQDQQVKGYEQIRDMQRAQQAQLRKLSRDGDSSLSKLEQHYRNQIHDHQLQKREELDSIQHQRAKEVDYERQSANDEIEDLRAQHAHQMNQLRQHSEEQNNRVANETRKEYERIKSESDESQNRAQARFDQKFKDSIAKNSEILHRINSDASRQVEEIRTNTAAKLHSYADRQSDPFYKLMNINARLIDDGDEYILSAVIPEYEQSHISAIVKGDYLMISGRRRNEEKIDLGDGRSKGTASFQSFHETFPLAWPVDSSRLTKEFEGDLVLIRVPKKNDLVFKKPEPKKPEKAKLEVPHFPDNIRKPADQEKSEGTASQDSTAQKAEKPDAGSGTLFS